MGVENCEGAENIFDADPQDPKTLMTKTCTTDIAREFMSECGQKHTRNMIALVTETHRSSARSGGRQAGRQVGRQARRERSNH